MNRLKEIRELRGWSQIDLAKRAGISPRTVLSAEKGRKLRMDTKRRLLRALGYEFREGRRVVGI